MGFIRKYILLPLVLVGIFCEIVFIAYATKSHVGHIILSREESHQKQVLDQARKETEARRAQERHKGLMGLLEQGSGPEKIVRLAIDGSLDKSFSKLETALERGYSWKDDSEVVVASLFGLISKKINISLVDGGELFRSIPKGPLESEFIRAVTEYLNPTKLRRIASKVFFQSDGKMVVLVEQLHDAQQRNTYQCVRFNPNGSQDKLFFHKAITSYESLLLVQPDNKIILGSQDNGFLKRLLPDGRPDESFLMELGEGFDRAVSKMWLLPDGKMLIFGDFSKFKGINISELVRLNSDWSIDYSFKPELKNEYGYSIHGHITDVMVQSDGSVILATEDNRSVDEHFFHEEIKPIKKESGIPDSFPRGGECGVRPMRSVRFPRLIRLDSSGKLDAEFLKNTASIFPYEGKIAAMATQKNKGIIVAGKFHILGKFYHSGALKLPDIFRLKSDGSLDTSFKLDLRVESASKPKIYIYVQPDQRILVALG